MKTNISYSGSNFVIDESDIINFKIRALNRSIFYEKEMRLQPVFVSRNRNKTVCVEDVP